MSSPTRILMTDEMSEVRARIRADKPVDVRLRDQVDDMLKVARRIRTRIEEGTDPS